MSQQQTPSATGSDQTTGTVQVVLVDNDILALKMLREIMSAWPRVAITWTEHNGSDASTTTDNANPASAICRTCSSPTSRCAACRASI